MYSVTEQLIDFFQFVMIGILISLIFDFFRAYRHVKGKRNSAISVMVQDIIYFFIVTIIIVLGIIYILDSSLRFYVFIAMILGIVVYISLLSRFFLKLYNIVIKEIINVTKFIFLPIELNLHINTKIINIFKKYIKKCCKNIFNMISYLCKGKKQVKINKNENKRGWFKKWKKTKVKAVE